MAAEITPVPKSLVVTIPITEDLKAIVITHKERSLTITREYLEVMVEAYGLDPRSRDVSPP